MENTAILLDFPGNFQAWIWIKIFNVFWSDSCFTLFLKGFFPENFSKILRAVIFFHFTFTFVFIFNPFSFNVSFVPFQCSCEGLSRSSHSQMFFEIGVLENSAIFTGKHLCWSLFLIKLTPETRAQVLYCKCCEIFKNTFFLQNASGGRFCFRSV